jgi:hypothetical protein
MFAKLSREPDFHQKIKKFFALAPIGTVKDIKGMFSIFAHLLYEEIKFFYTLFGDSEFLPTGELFTLISKYVCETIPGGEFCDNLMMLIMGVDSNQLNVVS